MKKLSPDVALAATFLTAAIAAFLATVPDLSTPVRGILAAVVAGAAAIGIGVSTDGK